jgi:radical SAM-linked protein
VLVKFDVRGNIRFLSHAETLRVFQRACIRAAIKMVYSQGFNPHPRLSLPLPRSVGVEADGDLLCLWVQCEKPVNSQSGTPALFFDVERFKETLAGQLPEGLQLVSVSVANAKTSVQPASAAYVFRVRQEFIDEKLKTLIKSLPANKTLNIERQVDEYGKIRNIDVRPFLNSIEFVGEDVAVECKVGSTGSIRVEEILKLLQLDEEKLASPVRRTNVQWQIKEREAGITNN